MERRWALLAVLGICLGCGGSDGPELADVSGKVTLDGNPLPNVNIQFTPKDGGSPSFGGTNAEGIYNLLYSQDAAGAMLGNHNVSITAREITTDDEGKPSSTEKPVTIPAKYREPGALTAEVKSGSNTIDFALKSK